MDIEVGLIKEREGYRATVWAPDCEKVFLLRQKTGEKIPLKPQADGYHSSLIENIAAGEAYRFDLDGRPYPDPASRFQPEGIYGPSMVVDPSFDWEDADFVLPPDHKHILYEVHVGTFTKGGTWAAAQAQLPRMKDLGVTTLSIMPLHTYHGKFNWGYDPVFLFAPTQNYGTPEDVRRFVNEAHKLGIAVLLDVVYNHLSTQAEDLYPAFSKDYFSQKHKVEWGPTLSFDGENPEPIRNLVLQNIRMWLQEYHFDGLRLDSVENIFDDSERHILIDIARVLKEERSALGIVENEQQSSHKLWPEAQGGWGLDYAWNDDFHHSALVRLTGKTEAYFSDYRGTPQEFISAAKRGYLYQGQYYGWQKKRRGELSDNLPRWKFVTFLENHDQIANSGRGMRVIDRSNPAMHRAMTALMLLSPGTPMLFQGQEGARTPFHYFNDCPPDARKDIYNSRYTQMSQFASLASEEMKEHFIEPSDPAVFEISKLPEIDPACPSSLMIRDLVRLRRANDIITSEETVVDGAVLGAEIFCLSYKHAQSHRLLLVNFGQDIMLNPLNDPLLATDRAKEWKLVWSSEHPAYDGHGTPEIFHEEKWMVPAMSALFFSAEEASDE